MSKNNNEIQVKRVKTSLGKRWAKVTVTHVPTTIQYRILVRF